MGDDAARMTITPTQGGVVVAAEVEVSQIGLAIATRSPAGWVRSCSIMAGLPSEPSTAMP